MQLPKPVFSIKFDLEKLKTEIQTALEENEWPAVESSFSVEFLPIYFFHYEVFSEGVNKDTNQKRIEKTQTKKGAINANNGNIESDLAGYPEKFQTISGEELSLPLGVNTSFKKINLQETEMKGIATLKIAALEGVAKDNIIITGIELAFVPFWGAKLELEGSKIEIRANGVDGKLTGMEKIIERKKELKELIFETLDDLQSPFSWVEYAFNLLKNKYVIIALILLVIIWVFFFKNPIV